ncbi:virulence factor family protein [Phyllobacterium sp. 0TCS1.6C]|uniref:AcvB/VirJ family lysyl-phosphatidylglycerol hydrolase n=1 Tax=unclassified Phyllobacterium TaxID=2638441 RepID=UPI00226406CD|nr:MULTISPECIES: AcvB/VirJ family lysyl-phosphatidylglycerol hydrolase [unclassified Phyllobacterium]MCX8279346.1 virulence factor family protein [Phyllobacterium sp. 0TCS1.6C]MCX8292463.1 virulence factor family protein [Phyllobacterium sp. 0TCS1.6A]
MKLPRRSLSGLLVALVLVSLGLALYLNYGLPGLRPNAVTVTAERLKDVPLLQPKGEVTGLAILVSQTGGPAADDRALADKLLDRGFLVLTVDLEKWRRELNQDTGDCTYFVADFEGLAKEAQRLVGGSTYMHPVIVGIGEGGVMAYASDADTPAATLAGAVIVDPAAALNTKLPSCEGADYEAVAGQGYSYSYNADLPNPAIIVREKPDAEPKGPPTQGYFLAEERLADTRAKRLDMAADAAVEIAREDASAGALPTIDIPAKDGQAKYLALFFSGDGGWRDIDKSVGDIIAGKSVHVVGVDSLRYYWSLRKPEGIAKDIAHMVAKADPGGRLPVVLLGYSFGANTLPFAWPYLPKRLQDRTAMIGLIGTEKTTPFQVSVGAWLGLGGDSDVAPAIARLPASKALCVYGSEEDDTACNDPALAAVEKIELAGDHHYDEKYELLAQKLMEALGRRLP